MKKESMYIYKSNALATLIKKRGVGGESGLLQALFASYTKWGTWSGSTEEDNWSDIWVT